jgi:hypothetical protein
VTAQLELDDGAGKATVPLTPSHRLISLTLAINTRLREPQCLHLITLTRQSIEFCREIGTAEVESEIGHENLAQQHGMCKRERSFSRQEMLTDHPTD